MGLQERRARADCIRATCYAPMRAPTDDTERPLPSPEIPGRPRRDRPGGRRGSLRAAFALAAALVPLGLAWAVVGDDEHSGRAAAAPSRAAAPTVDPALWAGTSDRPTRTRPRRPTAAQRLSTLEHPLVGAPRAALIARLGRPTRRATEGGPRMELLEYAVKDREFQIVLLEGRVAEVNRFR
jgi:hypothetical protein